MKCWLCCAVNAREEKEGSSQEITPTSQSDSWVLIAQCSRYSTRRPLA